MRFELRLLILPLGVLGACLLFFMAQRSPGLFANSTTMGAMLMLEFVIACLWRFETVFFSVTMGCFLLAATTLPLAGESFILRWLFLGIGAVVGFVVWMRSDRVRHFGAVDLVALLCVLAALASSSASANSRVGLLKAGSLFLLFMYASTGGRAALAGREKQFVRRLVLACEVLVFGVSACYLAGYNVFGNPNNLGAIIGVIAMPVLLWAALTAEGGGARPRRYIALTLCCVLLAATVCRAAIMTDVVITIVLTVAMRRPRILVKAIFAICLLVEIVAMASPTRSGELVDTLTGRFLFKKEKTTHSGIFGSRLSPWDETIAAIKQHPWFGTGFGTSDVGAEQENSHSSIYTVEGSNREHGSSYLAMAEYMGMLGILPFVALIGMVLRAIGRTGKWMRGAGSPCHYAVPFALITLAGLIHAAFEDWLFAAGSYLCVFFWVSAFLLMDLAPEPVREFARPIMRRPTAFNGPFSPSSTVRLGERV